MLKRILLPLLILVCNTLAAQDYVIRGFLHDASNGEPISDERVKVLKADSTPVAVAYSNIAGFFSIPKLAVGNYILKIEKGKYERSFLNVPMTAAKKIYDVGSWNLNPNTLNVQDVRVSNENKAKKQQIGMSEIKMDKQAVERIPMYRRPRWPALCARWNAHPKQNFTRWHDHLQSFSLHRFLLHFRNRAREIRRHLHGWL